MMSHLPSINSSSLKSLRSRAPALVITETSIYTSISIAALLGNSLVLWIVYKNRALRTIPNYFVISLACTDISMALLGTPWSIVVLATGSWPSNFAGCQVQGYVVILVAIASLQNLMIMAFNRYCRIVNQSLYRKVFTKNRTRLLIFLAYIIAAISALPYIIGGQFYVFQPGKFFCYQKSMVEYTIPLMLIFIGTPTVIILICYLKVFFALRNHQKNLHKPESERGSKFQRITVEEIRITRTLFATIVGYLLCWMPVLFIEIIDLGLGEGSLPRQVYMMFTMCGLSSSAINPVIYGVMNKTFRREYKKAFKCGASNTVQPRQSNSKTRPVNTINKLYQKTKLNETET
ncbi:melatonin receptor type 1A-like [Actinia tenebrosa]|uniref:Melatonin receptor type 1A-like n=1 Tax=Actinia tenebrosa TaxID=6105 RepID=A0A6P8IHH1_ACTTE|nr:melatonin receptor type 1A-like [Actinia tenebrosa]